MDTIDILNNLINSANNTEVPIEIEAGDSVNMKDVIFKEKVHLRYLKTPQLIDPDSGHTKNSGELYSMLVGKMSSVNGAMVNENITASPYHPGLVVDVRKDLDKLGLTIKNRYYEARASMVFRDEGLNQFRLKYQNSLDPDHRLSGMSFIVNCTIFTLEIISTSEEGVVSPVAGMEVGQHIKTTNVTNRGQNVAHGIIDKIIEGDDQHIIKVVWTAGRFIGEPIHDQEGDLVIMKSKVPFSQDELFIPVNDTVYTYKVLLENRTIATGGHTIEMNVLNFNRRSGNVAVKLPNNSAIHPLCVGGTIGIQGSQGFGGILDVYPKPSLVLADSFEADSPKGFQITYKSNNGNFYKQPIVEDLEGIEKGLVGANSAFCSLVDGDLNDNAYNIESIVNLENAGGDNEIGKYKITFNRSLKTSDYQINLTTAHPLQHAYIIEKCEDCFDIGVVTIGTETHLSEHSEISVICVGGN